MSIVNDQRLQDGLHSNWDVQRVQDHVQQAAEQHMPALVRSTARLAMSSRVAVFISISFLRRVAGKWRSCMTVACATEVRSSSFVQTAPLFCSTRCIQVATFDGLGVSGHPNHIATHYGVKRWHTNTQPACTVLFLVRPRLFE